MRLLFAQRFAAALACAGLIAPPAMATTPGVAPIVEQQPAAAVADVALAAGGVFTGKVVTAQGAPIIDSQVSIQFAGEEIAEATTNAEGMFAVSGLRSGLYTVVAENGKVTYRVWAEGVAPPAANHTALIVTGDAVLAGQYPGHGGPMHQGHPGILGWVREHPLLVGAGIAAAIAIPIAVADDDDEPASI